MSKKKNFKSNHFVVMTSVEATRAAMPKFNGHAVGHGVHGDTKYNRNREKNKFRREMLDY